MNRWNKAVYTCVVTTLLGATTACGGRESFPGLEVEAPARREARLTLTPAVEVSNLFDPALIERVVIDEIAVNLSQVRLLGSDPRIPAGGFSLLASDHLVSADTADVAALALPFPEYFLQQDDLAVYLRMDPTPALAEASIVIRARLFSEPVEGGASFLRAESGATDPDGDPARCRKTGATDPDGDPARGRGATDPDGDPARGRGATDPDGDPARGRGATDPDGDPARPQLELQRQMMVRRGAVNTSVPFELREHDAVDLLAQLDRHSRLDVVVGIPAARWFTPEVVRRLEVALSEVRHESTALPGSEPMRERRAPIVIDSRSLERTDRAVQRMGQGEPEASHGYFLADGEDVERLTVRRER